MHRLRAGRKPYSTRRPLEQTGYPVVGRPEMTSSASRVGAVAAWSGRSEVRRRSGDVDDGGSRSCSSSSSLCDAELRRALQAVSFVAVHLKNDDEYAEVRDGALVLILISFITN